MTLTKGMRIKETRENANKLFENYIVKTIGLGKKTLFKPGVKNIDEKTFNDYISTPRKSLYVVLLIAVLFLGYVVTPLTVTNLNISKNGNNII